MTPKDLHEWMAPRLDKLAEDIGEMKVVQAAQASDIRHHIKRTDLLEESVKPVAQHVAYMNGVLKFVGLVGMLVGIVASVWKLVN